MPQANEIFTRVILGTRAVHSSALIQPGWYAIRAIIEAEGFLMTKHYKSKKRMCYRNITTVFIEIFTLE